MFPLISITPKPPESPYWAKYFVWAENPFFQFYPLLVYHRAPNEAEVLAPHRDVHSLIFWTTFAGQRLLAVGKACKWVGTKCKRKVGVQ